MWMLTVREWCLPLERAGIVNNRGDVPTGAVGDGYDPDCTLDLDELMEEYAECFGTDEGQFDFSIDNQGPCLTRTSGARMRTPPAPCSRRYCLMSTWTTCASSSGPGRAGESGWGRSNARGRYHAIYDRRRCARCLPWER